MTALHIGSLAPNPTAVPTGRPAPALDPPSRVRRLPLRPVAPPYDDEVDGPHGAGHTSHDGRSTAWGTVEGAVPLPLAPPSSRAPRLRVVAAPESAPGPALAPPGPWSTRFLRAVLETLAGLRPVSQLGRWATTDVCRLVSRRAGMAERCRDVPRRIASLRSIHVSAPSDDVAEVCAVIDDGARVRAVALRMEARAGRWRCTALHVG